MDSETPSTLPASGTPTNCSGVLITRKLSVFCHRANHVISQLAPEPRRTRSRRKPYTGAAGSFRVLDFLYDEAGFDPKLAARMRQWEHSGFSVHNQIRVKAHDAEGLGLCC
ncbi:MAG: hypothetical protein HYY36_06105 [Gammaproteobacteria bacterium]|nr:hypothetical protein [Gammaproteobacteria bacterium]